MGRTKKGVGETVQILKELEETHRGSPIETRVRMLRLLRENQTRTLAEVAEILGKSERSVNRWWKIYCSPDGGLQALLEPRHKGRKKRIGEEELRALQERAGRKGFEDLGDIQKWLQESFGLNYSRSGLWYLMRTSLNAAPRGWMMLHDDGGHQRVSPVVDSSERVSKHIVNFLNSLPISLDLIEWVGFFRESLRALLGDVDRISVTVNRQCSLDNPEEYVPKIRVSQHLTTSKGTEGHVVVYPSLRTGRPSDQLLAEARAQGYPFEKYHEPHCIDYFYGERAWLGTIFLWREITKPEISPETIELVESLQPFIVFALSDAVARHQSVKPIEGLFYDALVGMATEAGLSAQERRIVTLQLMGHSYKEMADQLDVTVDTVKKHFKQIHKKTGTRGQAELFGKYFSSRLKNPG